MALAYGRANAPIALAHPLPQVVLTRLHRHVRAGIAPIGLARRAAQSAHLRRVVLTTREPFKDDVLRVAREDARQPVTVTRLDAAFVHVGALYRIDPPNQLAAGAVLKRETLRLSQFHLTAVRALHFKTGAEQNRRIVVAPDLHICWHVSQKSDQRLAGIVLGGRGCRATSLPGGHPGREIISGRL